MNNFMNLVKKSLVEGGTRGEVGASGGVETLVGALSLLMLDLLAGP